MTSPFMDREPPTVEELIALLVTARKHSVDTVHSREEVDAWHQKVDEAINAYGPDPRPMDQLSGEVLQEYRAFQRRVFGF